MTVLSQIAALPRLAHHGGRDAGHPAGDAEALAFQHGHVLRRGAVLLEIELRHLPDAVAQGEERLALAFHEVPDVRGVLLRHGLTSCEGWLDLDQNWYQYDARPVT